MIWCFDFFFFEVGGKIDGTYSFVDILNDFYSDGLRFIIL